jgi:hypothetical protein
MNPLGFALAGAVLLTTSLAAFDTLGQSWPSLPVKITHSEQQPAPVPVVQATAPRVTAADEPRRPVRVILPSPYDQRG